MGGSGARNRTISDWGGQYAFADIADDDATLNANYIFIKGIRLSAEGSLGAAKDSLQEAYSLPKDGSGEKAGNITLSYKAAQNADAAGTQFKNHDDVRQVKVVKFHGALADLDNSFNSAQGFWRETIDDDDYFIIEVESKDKSVKKYYRINVTVVIVPVVAKVKKSVKIGGMAGVPLDDTQKVQIEIDNRSDADFIENIENLTEGWLKTKPADFPNLEVKSVEREGGTQVRLVLGGTPTKAVAEVALNLQIPVNALTLVPDNPVDVENSGAKIATVEIEDLRAKISGDISGYLGESQLKKSVLTVALPEGAAFKSNISKSSFTVSNLGDELEVKSITRNTEKANEAKITIGLKNQNTPLATELRQQIRITILKEAIENYEGSNKVLPTNLTIVEKVINAVAGDINLSGRVDEELKGEISIELKDVNKFANLQVGDTVSDWFKNLPEGLTAKVKSLDGDTKAVITIQGKPKHVVSGIFDIEIAMAKIYGAIENLEVERNSNAKFTIAQKIQSSSGSGSNSKNSSINKEKSTSNKIVTDVSVSGNKLNATLSKKSVQEALKKNKDIAKDGVAVYVKSAAKAEGMSLKFPKEAVDAIVDAKAKDVKIFSPFVDLSFDIKAMNEIKEKAKSDVDFIIKKVETIKFDAQAQKLIEDRPAYHFSIVSGENVKIREFGGGVVKGSIPYTPRAGENVENLVVYYVDDSGKATPVKKSGYDGKNKSMFFETEHFSVYAVGNKSNELKFVDIDDHWAKDDIDYVAKKGLMLGIDENKFGPEISVDRGMFVTLLGRMAGIGEKAYTGAKFEDVEADKYYAQYVQWAAESGIVAGVSDKIFMPEQKITREQMAVMLNRYANVKGIKLPNKNDGKVEFADSESISDWAGESVKNMQNAGILSGKGDNMFEPAALTSRAEVAKVLHNFLENK